jgi:hypothetical protein
MAPYTRDTRGVITAALSGQKIDIQGISHRLLVLFPHKLKIQLSEVFKKCGRETQGKCGRE